jgi:hypothetical protein
MAVINQPPNVAVDQGGAVSPGWTTFFSNAFVILSALTQSGTTAQRPTAVLWTGRMYFDTTLGKPIWYKTAGWVDATGASV